MPFQEIDPKVLHHQDSMMDPKEFDMIKAIPGNDICVDCGRKKPDWGCVKNGILFCFNCSGPHRGLGTHICFVRSVGMDAWTPQQIQTMKLGGNQAFRDYLSANGIDPATTAIRKRYDNDAAELYRLRLAARVKGEPETAKLPPRKPKVDLKQRTMQGFGSAPPPPPSSPPKAALLVVGVAATAMAAAYLLSGASS